MDQKPLPGLASSSRRSFLRTGLAVGAGAVGAGVLGNGLALGRASAQGMGITKGDIAILRFL